MGQKKKLNLFTASYPYGFGESFLNNELPELTKVFNVEIFPYSDREFIQSSFDPEISVRYIANKETDYKLSFSDYLTVFSVFISEFLNIKQRWFLISKPKRFLSILKKGLKLSKWLDEQKLDRADAYYSFWMDEWALALAFLKRSNKIDQFVFRVNGYDIHDDRHEGNYLPFRRFIYSQTSAVIPLSKTSRDHIRELKIFPNKVQHNYFGTKDFGSLNTRNDGNLVFFTCSNAIPLKRLEKIAKVLIEMNCNLKWVHHGDGPTIENVNNLLITEGSKIEFKHSKKVEDYREVLELQKSIAPDLFINLSTTEGLPVTIMEAMSFGIPILANDVGSCKEFINNTTGILVESDASPKEIAAKALDLINGMTPEKREAIRKFWSENFSAEKNYSKFAQDLQTLFK